MHEIETTPATRPTDNKGRVLPDEMDERELLIEVVTSMRAVTDALEMFSESPMVASMLNGGSPLMAMMGRK